MSIPLRSDFDASQLRALARKTMNAAQTRRLLTLAVIYEGGSRTQAAEIDGVSLQTVRDWVLRWRLAALMQWLWDECHLPISKKTLSRELRALNFRKLSARP